MKKQILLDALNLTDQRPKGAQVYIFNLLRHLGFIDSAFNFTVLIKANKSNFGLPQSHRIHYERIYTHYPSLWRLLELPKYLRRKCFNLLHFMSEGSVFKNIHIPYIMTIHESLNRYYKYSEKKIGILDFKKRAAKIISLSLYQKMLRKADTLIASSHSTKKYLLTEHGVNKDKIKVIYIAIDKAFFNNEKKSQLENKIYNKPYILIFATGDRRENVICELRAFARIKSEIHHYLFIVGIPEGKFHEELTDKCNKLGILDRVRFFNFVPQDELVYLYKNSDLYVDMSFLEGFGLQVVEAMASGVPVITSNVDSLPEVIDNAGILLDPNDESTLANAMLDILKNDKKKKEMSLASRKQAQKFLWRKTAEQTLEVYDEVICQRFR